MRSFNARLCDDRRVQGCLCPAIEINLRQEMSLARGASTERGMLCARPSK